MGDLGTSRALWLQAASDHPTFLPFSAHPPPRTDPRNLRACLGGGFNLHSPEATEGVAVIYMRGRGGML